MADIISSPNTSPALLVIKVASASRPPAVAGAIAGVVRDRGWVEVQAIGAGAVNQAAKALAIARVYLMKEDINIAFSPRFLELAVDGNERTAMCFHVERRDGHKGANGYVNSGSAVAS